MPVLKADDQLVLRFGFRVPLLLGGDYGLSVAIADGDAQVHVQHHIVNEAMLLRVIPVDTRQHYYMVVNEHSDCQVMFLSNVAHA